MKTKTPSGTFLIRSYPKFQRGRNFDPFPSHAVYWNGIEINACASGRYILFVSATLKTADDIKYPSQFCDTLEEAYQVTDAYKKFQSANGYVGLKGEWYNAQFRACAFDKIKSVNWPDWLRSH
jgi:hypothetical protein